MSLFFLSFFFFQTEAQQKKIKYKSHTQIDFSAQRVKGKARSPDVFYVFQRKRSKGHQIVRYPRRFIEDRKETKSILKRSLP